MLKSILIAISGSPHSDAAVELAIGWARRFDALLVGIGIVDEPAICRREPVPIGAGAFKVDRDRSLLADAKRQVEGLLEGFQSRCAMEGVRCQAVQEVGAPVTQVVQHARGHDLIMLGQKTQFDFDTRSWPDETLRAVLRQTARPVVAVPEPARNVGCVVVAYDGSSPADRAVQSIEALGLAGDDEVHVLSVQLDPTRARQLAQQGANFLRLHGVKATPLPLRSTMSVDRIIIGQVQNLRPRLLVMGAYGRSMWQEFVFGSVTTRVLEATPTPLFLCH